MQRSPKKVPPLIGAIAVLSSVCLALVAGELAFRRQVEGTWPAVFGGLFSGPVPYSELRGDQWVISDPELGYRLNPQHSSTNSLGLRHPEIPLQKPPGAKRILVIGDSIAAGSKGFVAILREKLKHRADVINGATPGYTIYQERLSLERDLIHLEPDLVILQYCTNDHHKFLHRFNPEAQLLITESARWVLVPDENDPLFWLPRNSYIAGRMRLALFIWRTNQGVSYPWDKLPDFATAWRSQGWRDYREDFRAIHQLLDEKGSKLAVVAAPLAAQFDEEMLQYDAEYVLKPQLELAKLCKEYDVPLLDLYPVFYRQGGLLFNGDGIHFNQEGHRVAARALEEFLESNHLIPGG